MTSYGSPRPGQDPRRGSGRASASSGRSGSGGTYGSGGGTYSSRGSASAGSGNGWDDAGWGAGGDWGGGNGDGVYGAARSSGGASSRGSASGRSSASGRGRTSGAKSTGRPGGKRPTGGRSGTKRRKARSPWWATLAVVVGVLVMIGGLGGMVLTKFVTGQVNSAISQVSLLAPAGKKATSINGAINILMVGLDTRDGDAAMGSRADSIIIAHIPVSHDTVDLISIPRDTYVPIPANKATRFAGWSDKINAAFQFGSQNGGGAAGGVQLLQKVIQQQWGITFQGALIVNFDGFSDIVKKIGGVRMYVDETTKSLHHGYVTGHPNEHTAPYKIHPDGTPGARIPGTTPVIYTKGWHTFNAYDALDFVRCRDFLPHVDYDRQRHQQQFIKALMEQAYSKGISEPLKISSFLSSLGKAFVFDGGGHNTSDWIFTLKGISPSAIRTIQINGGTFNTVMVDGKSTQQMSDLSKQLLADVRSDTVDNFLALHPDWVTASK